MGFLRRILKRIHRLTGSYLGSDGQAESSELNIIFNHIPMAIYWKDADYVYMGCNKQFEAMTNSEPGALTGKTDMDLHVPEVAERFRQEDMEFASGLRKSMYFTDKLIPMKDSAPIWARTYKIPVFDDDGKLIYIMGLIQDVTKVKENEIALKESESRLMTILNATDDHIIFVDTQGKILVANDSFLSDFSLQKDETIDKKLEDIASPQLYESFQEKIQMAINTGKPCYIELLPNESPHGKYLDISFYPVLAEGITTGTAIYVKDITYSKQAEEIIVQHSEQLQIAINEAENASKSKSEFLSRMSHEIRTPLNAIIGMAKIAGSTDDHHKIKDCIQKVDSSSRHLLGIINDVLDMSKIEAGKFELSDTVFRMEDMLKDISNVVSVRADEKKQEFEIILDKKLSEYFCADELRLRQVVTNLLSNSIKFTPEQGVIRLYVNSLQSADGVETVEMIVSDTGIGISPEQQARLFQPFEQADGGITRKFGGTGLGLAICKTIVEMMGGHIRIESVQGEGSRFIFDVKMKIHQQTTAKPVKSFSDVRALIVDDSAETREYLSQILAGFKIRSETAEDGFEAIGKVEELKKTGESFNVFFIDWSMPGIDGIETTRRIKSVTNDNAVVIMISVTAWNEIENEAVGAGIFRFISKPLFPSTVLNALEEIKGMPSRGTVRIDETGVPDLEGYKILLAEDIEINREIAAALLELTKVEIDFAVNGKEAVDIFNGSKDKYDLILMDIHMPEMDGYEATRLIRSNSDKKSQSIPIIAMTADAFKEDIDKCKRFGMNDHIAKPIDENELFKKILLYISKTPKAIKIYAPREKTVESDIPVLDEQEALRRLNGNKNLFIRFLKSFMENNPHDRLKESINKGDMEKAAADAHAVKGLAANLSLKALYNQAARLEADLKGGSFKPEVLSEYEKTLDITKTQIEKYLIENDPEQ